MCCDVSPRHLRLTMNVVYEIVDSQSENSSAQVNGASSRRVPAGEFPTSVCLQPTVTMKGADGRSRHFCIPFYRLRVYSPNTVAGLISNRSEHPSPLSSLILASRADAKRAQFP